MFLIKLSPGTLVILNHHPQEMHPEEGQQVEDLEHPRKNV
jgi:hypothetical protein